MNVMSNNLQSMYCELLLLDWLPPLPCEELACEHCKIALPAVYGEELVCRCAPLEGEPAEEQLVIRIPGPFHSEPQHDQANGVQLRQLAHNMGTDMDTLESLLGVCRVRAFTASR
jgi:hypothetical protein